MKKRKTKHDKKLEALRGLYHDRPEPFIHTAEDRPLAYVTTSHILDTEAFSELSDLRQCFDPVIAHYSPAIERSRDDDPLDRVGPFRSILGYCGVFSAELEDANDLK